MKNIIRTLIVASTLMLGAAAGHAQAPFKLVVVNMARVFDNHYKKAEADAKFRETEQSARKNLEDMRQQGQGLVDEFRALEEKTKSAMLTDDAKAQATREAQAKIDEIRRLEQRIEEYRQTESNQLQQRIKVHRDLLLEEISGKVTELAKRRGATLVLDSSGPSLFGISNVIYSDPAYDITEEVLTEVNKDRPPTTSTTSTTTPSTTPAASGSTPLFNPAATQPKQP